jgi:hypothetical protein
MVLATPAVHATKEAHEIIRNLNRGFNNLGSPLIGGLIINRSLK